MSVESMALVLHHSRTRGTARLVMVGVANHDGDGGAYPSLDTLTVYTGVECRATQDGIRQCVEAGELSVTRQAGGGVGVPDHLRPNLYRILIECPPWCAGGRSHRCRDHGMPASRCPECTVPAASDMPGLPGVQDAAPGAGRCTGGVQDAAPLKGPYERSLRKDLGKPDDWRHRPPPADREVAAAYVESMRSSLRRVRPAAADPPSDDGG